MTLNKLEISFFNAEKWHCYTYAYVYTSDLPSWIYRQVKHDDDDDELSMIIQRAMYKHCFIIKSFLLKKLVVCS